jgi:DNA-binding NarL/FixJ family response regulator
MAEACKVRVLLVDDHTIFRQGLRCLLDSYPNIQVVGEAGNGEEALVQAESLQPNLVVMDINMPKMDGIMATRHLKRQFPDMLVVGLSFNAESESLTAMREAGAVEVVTKEKAVEDLYEVIEKATTPER